jgi:peptidyl-prolyl cis-trans isomerase SurA
MLLPQLRDVVAKLPEGGVSDPLPSPMGVHIFKLRERRDPNQPRAEPRTRLIVQRVSLAQVIFPLPPDAKEADIKAAEKQATALAPRLRSCKAIDDYAERTESSGSGSIGWLKVSDLPDVLQQLVTQLEPQQISPPFRGPLGVQLLMVCDREGRQQVVEAPPPPPPPAPPTPEEMRARLEDEQLQRLANRYLRELRRDAFIDIRMGA